MNSSLLRKAALIEGTTLVLLVLIAVPLKRMAGMPEFVSILGPIHGIAFITYCLMLSNALSQKVLDAKQTTTGFVAAFIPFGSFAFEHFVLKQPSIETV